MFFRRFLQIPDVKTRFLRDRVKLLKDIVRASVINIPFQNATSFGVPPPGPKSIPSFKSMLDASLLGRGGMCGHNNYSMKILLESIGYETYACAAKFRRTLVEGSHVVCVVKIPALFSVDKSKDDLYVVDVGCGVPLMEPLRINSLPYSGRAGGFDFSYEISEDGNVVSRVHKGGDAIGGAKPQDYLCPQDYTIWLAPKSIQDLYVAWGEVYGEPKSSAFHNTFYLFRYMDIKPDNSDFKIVCIRGKELLFLTRETRVATAFKTFDEIRPLILQYFSMIPRSDVELAVSNFSQIESGEAKFQTNQGGQQ